MLMTHDDNKEINYLSGVTFNIQNERVRNRWGWCNDDDNGGNKVDDKSRQGRLARGPVRCPKLVSKGQWNTLLCQLYESNSKT